MSTGYSKHINTRTEDRFAQLARLGETVFHAKDLANLWQITSKNTLYTTLKRYTQKGLIFRIHKGLYTIKPPNQIDPALLGLKTLRRFAYVSTETVLTEAGIIQQTARSITLISDLSKRFTLPGTNITYVSRKLNDVYLYQPEGIGEHQGIKKATPVRAVSDLLYFNPKAYLDAQHLINWNEVKTMQKRIGYPPTPERYDST